MREGLRIGRGTGEILLKDSKISSLHAQIEREKSGQLALVDRGSANGIVINGQKVARVILIPGVNFRLGRTKFSVAEGPAPEGDSFVETQVVKPKQKQQLKMWQKTLIDEVPLLLAQNRPPEVNIAPFVHAVQLEFTQGAQFGQKLVIGYGPRKLGSALLDIEIQDAMTPFLAFELVPEGSDARFVTRDPIVVRLNSRATASAILQEGDTIQIGDSIMLVSFIK